MSEIRLVARFTVREGKREAFEVLARTCLETVQQKDSETLAYDWFFSPDGSECVVQELYRDSAAVLTHIGHVGETLGQLGEVADLRAELYGTPSNALVDALAGVDCTVYTPFQGL